MFLHDPSSGDKYFEGKRFVFDDVVEGHFIMGTSDHQIVVHEFQVDDVCVVIDREYV